MKSARKAPRKPPLRILPLREVAGRRRAEEAPSQSHDPLEQRVRQRTAELGKINQAFQAEITRRNRIEEELRVRTTALDAAANAVVITDPNGTIQSVNSAFTALTGYTAQEAVGQNSRLLKSGKQDEAVYRNLWQTISSGRVWSGELTNRRKDGSLYTEEMTITPVRSADGTIARYIAIKQDVSERKRIEAGAAQLAAIVAYSSDAIISKDLDGTILTWNAAAGRLFGYAAEAVIGQNIALLIPEDCKAGEIAILEKVRKGEGVQHYESIRLKKDGTPLAVSLTISPVKDAAGNIVGTSKIIRDISEHKRAEEALRASSAYARSLIEASLDPLVTISAEGKITDVNEASVQATGVPRQEIIGTGFSDYFTEPEKAREGYRQVFSKGFVRDYPLAIRHRSGSITDVFYNASVFRDEQGQVLGVFAAARDITERNRAREEILKLNAELEQRVHDRTAQLEAANRELEAFCYSVSHELRAPLRHIGGFADLLAKSAGPGLQDKSRHYLEEILDSTKQMGCLIDDLLLFSRMGRAEMRLQPVDLKQLVEEAKKQLEPENKGRDIRWKQSALLEVQGDGALLRQVMLNLLSNALKYTRPRQPAEIEIGCDGSSPQETVVFVRDNGVGFDMEYAHKLFGIFQRLHSDEEFEGTGIGLASVRRIIARHGGRTWAEGKVNAGATFYFSLPKNNHPPDIYDHSETHSPG